MRFLLIRETHGELGVIDELPRTERALILALSRKNMIMTAMSL